MGDEPILIGLGANLPHLGRPPRQTLEAALDRLGALGAPAVAVSPWYRSRAVPASDQPDFVNGAAVLRSELEPHALLDLLHRVEREFGRTRGVRFAARTLDLDLLGYGDRVAAEAGGLQLPHPGLPARAFVLVPLADVAPAWRHPVLGRDVAALRAALPEAERRGIVPCT